MRYFTTKKTTGTKEERVFRRRQRVATCSRSRGCSLSVVRRSTFGVGHGHRMEKQMSTAATKSATVTINPKGQTLDSVNRLVAQVLGRAGCDHCGRIAVLKVDFLGDPPDVMGRDGVISFQTAGF
jgi:hypothetical protein